MMKVVTTDDGSDTLFRSDLNEHYHSTFGAVQESQHIFIEQGFLHAIGNFSRGGEGGEIFINIFEVGFGTGLNALLTQAEAEKHGIKVQYTAIEAFPLAEKYWQSLNYPYLTGSADFGKVYASLHLARWNQPVNISGHFTLLKIHGTLATYFPPPCSSDLIYFDAFGPDVQPELWSGPIFQNLFNGLSPGGFLVTYSVKGTVVRALRAAGFITEKIAGPPGKRHILRARKSRD
jgi:tRNA U34 5-methylaminomethyl-2-thiouridine-forming methyltransferase MnmC